MFRIVGILLVLTAGLAHAEEKGLSCSLWATTANKALFSNSGEFATTGGAIMAAPECVHEQSGFYGNLFFVIPTHDFDTGKEIDVRIGRRFKAGAFSVDASIADFYFGIGDGRMYNTVNGRVRVAHTFELGNGTVEPYALVDYQRSTTLHQDASAIAGGVVVNTTLTVFPGQPNLSVDLGAWKYGKSFGSSKGPVRAVQASLSWKVNEKLSIGPSITWASGSVNGPGTKHMAGIFMVYTF